MSREVVWDGADEVRLEEDGRVLRSVKVDRAAYTAIKLETIDFNESRREDGGDPLQRFLENEARRLTEQQSYTVACDFCEKTREQVRKLIAGPRNYICDECIRLCFEILETDV